MKDENAFSQEQRPVVYLVGIGMGGEDQLTGRAMDCLEAAQVITGADRMLESVRPYTEGKRVFSAYKPSEMVQWLGSFKWEEAALVLSGDTGFYSGAEAAAKAFMREGWDVEYVPGVSSLSYFCARLGKSWQNVHPVSSHGRECDVVAHIRNHRSCFILLGGPGSVSSLCRQLVSSGMSHVDIWAGENLSYEDERITWAMTPAELIMEDEHRPFGSLACVLVENDGALEEQLYPVKGPEDSEFIRGPVPMTKSEVRRLSLEKLRIGHGAVCYDIGAGTGSVAVEMGLEIRRRGGNGEVYAIERSLDALQLIQSNCQKFHGGWQGFHIVEGGAPEAMEGLPMPTHAFIGGSGGKMQAIVEALVAANPGVRIVANAITLETLGEILDCMRNFGFQDTELTQVWAAKVETVGAYHMPKAQNPVYIAVMQNPSLDSEEIQWQEL
ncbi:precorrin-6y C5,15-methyltransferase (decarboxylating) subunit CbiE [Enterocloster aldenensis]|uniref:precorrin-6y C5,15-methyltransferase (decarboxylating) subunit CbiE n=1 Tax=Enterocloster aldenensis TaxID=358742 RepID=UPI0035198BCD